MSLSYRQQQVWIAVAIAVVIGIMAGFDHQRNGKFDYVWGSIYFALAAFIQFSRKQ